MRGLGHAEHMGVKSNAYKVLVEKSERSRVLVRLRHRCEDSLNWMLENYGGGSYIVVVFVNMVQLLALFYIIKIIENIRLCLFYVNKYFNNIKQCK